MIAGTDGTVLHLTPLVHDLVVDVDVAGLPDTNAATKRVLMNDAGLGSGYRAVDYDRRLGNNSSRQTKQVAVEHNLTKQDKTNDRQNRYPRLSTLSVLFQHLNPVLIMDS